MLIRPSSSRFRTVAEICPKNILMLTKYKTISKWLIKSTNILLKDICFWKLYETANQQFTDFVNEKEKGGG